LEPERARLLAHLSGGRPGTALRLNQQPELLDQRQAWLDEHARLLASNRVERFAYAEALTKDKEASRQVLQYWLSFWRDVLLRSISMNASLINLDRAAEVDQIVQQIDASAARQAVAAVEHTISLLEANVNARLAVEVLLLDLPRLADLPA
jgi:DNA polymerase-3 subunit delta'